MKNRQRTGFTTGACAAAAAKAAVTLCLGGGIPGKVEIPFPDGSRVTFPIHQGGWEKGRAFAVVIKDGGDDADVTHGAEVMAYAAVQDGERPLLIKRGEGVGLITKPGLALPPGEAAINPVPRRMITLAVAEASKAWGKGEGEGLEVTIAVPDGERRAEKTLNKRLGIVGGISILGTTGVVIPVSTEAFLATITSSLQVAKAMGHEEIVLAAGRSSERAHRLAYHLPEEAYVLMGDHVEFSLKAARELKFRRIHLVAQWGKLCKMALGQGQTHTRFGVLDMEALGAFLLAHGLAIPSGIHTARQLYHLLQSGKNDETPPVFTTICQKAAAWAAGVAGGIPVSVHLACYEGRLEVSIGS